MKHFDIEGDIEKGIEQAQDITVEFAIAEAIMKGRMSPEEGAECLEAYTRTLKSSTEVL